MIVADDRVAHFVGQKVGEVFQPPYACLGVEREGDIVAGIVFNVWTGPDVQLTIAAEKGAISRRFLRRVGLYITKELGCIRATIETEQPHVIDLVRRMGGEVEGIKRNLFGEGRDGTVMGVLKKDFRW